MIPVVPLVKLWLAVRPFKRLKERREAKRLAAAQAAQAPPDSTATPTAAPVAGDQDVFSELAQSMGRSALKVIGSALVTYAVTHGLVDAGQTDGLTTALEAIGGGVLTIGGLWLSHRKHSAA